MKVPWLKLLAILGELCLEAQRRLRDRYVHLHPSWRFRITFLCWVTRSARTHRKTQASPNIFSIRNYSQVGIWEVKLREQDPADKFASAIFELNIAPRKKAEPDGKKLRMNQMIMRSNRHDPTREEASSLSLLVGGIFLREFLLWCLLMYLQVFSLLI